MNGDEPTTRIHPPCDFCRLDAHYGIEFFSHIRRRGPIVHACARCLERNARLRDMLGEARFIRITSLVTGKKAMGRPQELQRLIQNLEPTGRFRTITSAIRLAAESDHDSGLVCTRCRKPIHEHAPGAVAWSLRPDGTRHSVRVYHIDCLPEDAVFGKTCVELEHIESLDDSTFSLPARELLRQIRRLAAS